MDDNWIICDDMRADWLPSPIWRPVLAVDPGTTAGLAWMDSHGHLFVTTVSSLPGVLYQLSLLDPPKSIITEKFQAHGARSNLDAVKIDAAITGYYVGHSNLYPNQWHQMPEARKPYLDDARKLVQPSKYKVTQHAVDALAHMLVWADRLSRALA